MTNSPFSGQIFWNKWLPPKVNCFMWRVFLKRIQTKVNLSKRGIVMPSQRCPICNGEDETEDHLFLSCPVSKAVWTWIFKWCGVNMEQFNSLDHLLSILVDNATSAKKRMMSEAIVGGAVWSIWKARNNLVFKGNSFSAPIVFGEFQASLYTWVKYRGNCKSLLWQMWCSNPFSLL